MANRHETTFGELQVDERFKKLQRSLKLDLLRQEHGRSVQDGKASSVTTWPSISSINIDSLDYSCSPPSLQTSLIKSEVLASSNNLRNIFLEKKSHNTKKEIMTTSSVEQYQQDSLIDRFVMPPPAGSTVYRAFKQPQNTIHIASNCEKAASSLLNKSVQSSTVNTFSLKSGPSCISSNTNANKEYVNTFVTPATPINNFQKIDRVFSKWRVMLNDQYELIIKGTLEDGRVARSKPVIRRYSATCVESKYKHKYILQGNIVDERNGLPDYIRGKFYNGFPDDWENIYQIWRTYVSKGCPVMFRWPTPITDSDDDLKSELTDLTYTCVRNKKTIPATESCNLNDYTKTENLNNTLEKKEKCNYSINTYNSQNYEKNASFVKPFISNSEKDVILIEQTKNIKSLRDEDNKQNFKSEINPLCSSRKANKLTDILQEDKLNIIINNLADRNCSPKYIDKIIEMFDCLDYVVSYRTESERNNDSVVFASRETSKSETILMQQNLICDDNCTNTNKPEDKITKLKSYGHSTDLGYGSIKNDSNAIQLSNPVNIKPKDDNDSDKSESETYAGVPKISIERVLKSRETSRRTYKRKVRKKMIYPDAEKHATDLTYDVEEVKFKSVHVANPITITKKNLPPDESCVSITEDEVEMSNKKERRQTINVTQRPQKMTFSSHREIQRNNFDLYGRSKSSTHVQNEQPFDTSEAQKVNLNVFIKEKKIPYRVQEKTHSQVVADVDYPTNSDIDVVTISTSTRKSDRTDRNMITSHANANQDIVINSENNSDFPEKPRASPKLRREFIEQTKSEIATKKAKPTIISSMPVNLNLRISRADPKARQLHDFNVIVKNEDEQDANIQPLKETDKKKTMLKTSVAKKSAINDSHSKTTVDNKREVCPITNNKNESANINPTNPTNSIEQPKSNKLGVEKNPKVLTTWIPKVVYYAKSKSELGLTFQGKLLNEAGHVVHRMFTTDIVLRRLSMTLIETVNHEFYELLGHLNDNKHVIPKELVKQCRYGCPAKIEQFCLTWKMLHDNVQEVGKKFHDTTMDSLNAPVSSRGRHIVPPLSYWTGERITLKDNNLVYSPGNSKESSLLSLTDNSTKIQKNNVNTENGKKQKVKSEDISKKQSVNKLPLPKSNKTSATNKNQTIVIEKARISKSPKIEITNNIRRSDNSKKSGKSVNSKRRLAKKLTFSSTDSSEEEQKTSPRKRMRSSQTNENADPSRYTMTLRKRQRIEYKNSNTKTLRRDPTKSRYYTAYYSPTKRSENKQMTYTYYQDVPQSENFLSENEVSFV